MGRLPPIYHRERVMIDKMTDEDVRDEYGNQVDELTISLTNEIAQLENRIKELKALY
jgi:hypothetical protein